VCIAETALQLEHRFSALPDRNRRAQFAEAGKIFFKERPDPLRQIVRVERHQTLVCLTSDLVGAHVRIFRFVPQFGWKLSVADVNPRNVAPQDGKIGSLVNWDRPEQGFVEARAEARKGPARSPHYAIAGGCGIAFIGIDPANHTIVFEKLYQLGKVELHSSGRTKFKGGGPGLGLAIAAGIVKAHKGKIWVESPGYDEEKLPGSTFIIQIPLAK